MNTNLTPYCQPGPSTSKDDDQKPPSNVDEEIHFPPYQYEMVAAEPSTSSGPPLTYPLPLSVWSNSPSFPPYMSMSVNSEQPSYIYPPTSSLRLPPTEQIPPNCLDWTINLTKAPLPQFKTTSEQLFTLGFSSTVSENWMEGDKGLQYSIKNFMFSTKRIRNSNEACSVSQSYQYDSLLVSIPQVQYQFPYPIKKMYCCFCYYLIQTIMFTNLFKK